MFLTEVWLRENGDENLIEFYEISSLKDAANKENFIGLLRRHPVNPNRCQLAATYEGLKNKWGIALQFNRKSFIQRGDTLLKTTRNQRAPASGTSGTNPILLSWEQVDYEPDPVFYAVRVQLPCSAVYYFEDEEFKWLLDAIQFEL